VAFSDFSIYREAQSNKSPEIIMVFLAARIHNFASARDRKEIDAILKQNPRFCNI
jgi:hypothetical protein